MHGRTAWTEDLDGFAVHRELVLHHAGCWSEILEAPHVPLYIPLP